NKLHYAGHVGSGLTDDVVKRLRPALAELTRKTPVFVEEPPLHRPTSWLEPKLVVEVTFTDWTPDGLLRAPVFNRVREHIEPRSIKRDAQKKATKPSRAAPTPASEIEAVLQQLDAPAAQITLSVAGSRIKLTNLDREYWPAAPGTREPPITKREYIQYLARV